MVISTSSEFVALCRSQLALLNQALGAVFSVVYLTEEMVEEGTAKTKLIPLVAYPETAGVAEGQNALVLLPEDATSDRLVQRQAESSKKISTVTSPLSKSWTDVEIDEQKLNNLNLSLLPSAQIVLPLMHEEALMGLLVTRRNDRVWNQQERSEIERIAQTLAIASLLDRRREWFEQQLNQQQRLQAKQRDLLDNLLHQFRNPLTALRTFGKLLLKRLSFGDGNRAIADNIVRESDRLQELLQQFDRVIDLTVDDINQRKLPSGLLEMEATLEPVASLLPNSGTETQLCSVHEVLEPLLESAKAIALERNLEIQAEITPNLLPVRANSQALREVFSNLLDNALKYTLSGGKIYIQTQEQGNFQGIAISDTGVGIPPEDLGHIFERHYRGVQSDSHISGTGLGLAIAKELIEQMQGEIEVFSPAQYPPNNNQGTTFIVWLPIG